MCVRTHNLVIVDCVNMSGLMLSFLRSRTIFAFTLDCNCWDHLHPHTLHTPVIMWLHVSITHHHIKHDNSTNYIVEGHERQLKLLKTSTQNLNQEYFSTLLFPRSKKNSYGQLKSKSINNQQTVEFRLKNITTLLLVTYLLKV